MDKSVPESSWVREAISVPSLGCWAPTLAKKRLWLPRRQNLK